MADLALEYAVAPANFDLIELRSLLFESFEYMKERIDPPSSLELMDLNALQKKASDETLIVVFEDDVLKGCVFCREEQGLLYVGKLAVSASLRGRGVARRLIAMAADRATALGLQAIELETRIELIENHRTFERLGFYKISESAHEGYNRPTSIRMRLDATSFPELR